MRGHFSCSSVCWNEICIYGLITISLYPLSAQRLLYFNLQPQEKNSCALGGENQQRSVNNNSLFCLEKHLQDRQGTFNIQAACYRNMLNAKANRQRVLVSPGLDVVEQMLPAVVDVLQLVVDFRLLRLVAGCDELFSELLQMRFILTEEIDLFHTVLVEKSME